MNDASRNSHPGVRSLDEPLRLEEIPTPALVVDVAVMSANLERMARHAEEHGIALRPHTKTHKSPLLARRQMDLGAVGVCAAKVSEAEVMVAAGVGDVLITSPVVSGDKIERVVALASRSPGVWIVVDDARAAHDLNAAAEAAGCAVGVLIDLDPGIGRTGCTPGEPALALRRILEGLPSLRFHGMQAYAGHVMHVEGWERRRQASYDALRSSIETKALLEREGFAVPVFTGGGTGTFDIDVGLDVFTDLQVGSYLFMDEEYRRIGGRQDERNESFAPALFVLATAISRPRADRITIDAGFKALATDTVKPVLHAVEGLTYFWGGDEHGILVADAGRDVPLALGDRVQLVVPHCDPTVNLYDVYWPLDNGVVSELWPVAARGCSQ